MYSKNIKKVIDEFYILTDYKNPYNNLNKSNERQQKVCELLEELLFTKGLSQDLTMWAYWNISDNYALQRKSQETYNNHKAFEKYLDDKDIRYKLLLLVDTTQRLTLINGGYGKYWDNLYYDIINNIKIDESNIRIVFSVLRTATYNHMLNNNESIIEDALNKMKFIIENYDDTKMIKWFKLCYYCSLIPYNFKHNIHDNNSLEESFRLLEYYSKILNENNKNEKLIEAHNDGYLFGSFEYWNRELDEYRQARFIQNLIIQYIDAKHYDYVKRAFNLIKSDEFESKYFKSKVETILNK